MPAAAESLGITDAYRRRLVQLRDATATSVADGWDRLVRFEDLDGSGRLWLAGSTSVVGIAQMEAARTSDRYLAGFLSSELTEQVPPTGLDWTSKAGRTVDGRPLRALLAGALITVKVAVLRGAHERQAMRSGLARAMRVARTEPMDAGRASLQQLIDSDDRVRGWRRVTSGAPCGACLGAATGAIHRTSTVMPCHPSCRCVAEPCVRGMPEHHHRPTGQQMWDAMSQSEQNHLFAGTGGKAKADLIRDGHATLADLVERHGQHQWHDTITERPLAGLPR